MRISYTLYSYVPVPNEIPEVIRDYPVSTILIAPDRVTFGWDDDDSFVTLSTHDTTGQRRLYNLSIDGQPPIYPRTHAI